MISWQLYTTYLGALLVIYYLILFLRKEKSSNADGNSERGVFPRSFFQTATNGYAGDLDQRRFDDLSQSSNALVFDLVNEIQAYFMSVPKPSESQQLAADVKSILNKYQSLQHHPNKSSINILISESLEENCSIHVSDEEIEKWWTCD